MDTKRRTSRGATQHTAMILTAAWLAAQTVSGFETHEVSASRRFDAVVCPTGHPIVVSAIFTNREVQPLRGFVYTDHLPSGLSVTTTSVRVGSEEIADYRWERDADGSVYPERTPHRWVLEQPAGFAESNAVGAGATVEIVYSITSSETGVFPLNEFSWAGYYPSALEAAFGYSETGDQQTVIFQDSVPDTNGIFAFHACPGYHSPGTNAVVSCVFAYPEDQSLTSLVWRAILPVGWTVLSASGDGAPETDGTNITFTEVSATRPLTFDYRASAPGNQATTNPLGGEIEFRFRSMPESHSIRAVPDPLWAPRYHSADYQAPHWVIDGIEMNRVLAYWRAGGYVEDPAGHDGYAPTPFPNTGGPFHNLHSADGQTNHWVLDDEEANRVLAYWRAGGYRLSSGESDGYAPADTSGNAMPAEYDASDNGSLTVLHSAGSTYNPANTLVVSNAMTHTGTLYALGFRPEIPKNWELVGLAGDGAPEFRRGEILWTGELPSSPIRMTYTLSAPLWELGDRTVRSAACGHFAPMVNAEFVKGAPEMLSFAALDTDVDGMPDGWEAHFCMHPTNMPPGGDADGDGMINLHECLAGTDPTNELSFLGLSRLSMLESSPTRQATIEWTSATNRRYHIVQATNLFFDLQPVASNLPATPPENVYTTQPPLHPANIFYRIELNEN